MQNVIIFGASGHGSVVLDCLEKEGRYNVIGFVDSFKKKGSRINGYQVLGSEVDLPYLINRYHIDGGIVAIGDNWTRKLIVDRILKIAPNFSFINTVHPNAVLGKDILIGCGNVFMPGAIVNANSIIHDFCIINTNASLGHDGIMDSYSSLAPSVCAGGGLRLGRYSAISLGVNVINGIEIGQHSVIGAGSLVVDHFGDNIMAYGLPAKIVRVRAVGEPYLSTHKKWQSCKLEDLDEIQSNLSI
ncbi:NeuD/PglB/VioB family sugar acetyltransferase [Maribacter ulvicola]|uniref:Sugar O-acyltransferase, sialic acid O-acetyltransferase NeuD family n=1 Tax=Maribacter ulvicola TaxID=228959 RepID=A0A1N6WTH9_9FLAO|nr:NeuD/PglB/VioB family sugar acetyltransferase [Maribacter ulvicola]SIQ93372.1 sugar O-acyltransferase, sialic acid O-acetyltransferase NeuD family [Maribacter ulvicola]